MKRIKVGPNERGFQTGDFVDLNGERCSIQESSLATESALWLGLNTGTHHRGQCMARMHLSVAQVKKLLPLLERFVETGGLS